MRESYPLQLVAGRTYDKPFTAYLCYKGTVDFWHDFDGDAWIARFCGRRVVYKAASGHYSSSTYRTGEEAQEDIEALIEIAGGPTLNPNATGDLWDNDLLQFARLISEINATQEEFDMHALASSMDLDIPMVVELFDRADSIWEDWKANYANS